MWPDSDLSAACDQVRFRGQSSLGDSDKTSRDLVRLSGRPLFREQQHYPERTGFPLRNERQCGRETLARSRPAGYIAVAGPRW
jgi:hypothetical protein